jgi:thiamine biosynthesis protein ThiI
VENLYLLKYGELSLKGGNRRRFENQLCNNIRDKLKGMPFELIRKWGRLYVRTTPESGPAVEKALERTFGLVSFSRALRVNKEMPALRAAAAELAGRLLESGKRFRIEARRSDKSFAPDSYGIARELGAHLLSCYGELEVDLSRPDWVVKVEIREAAYLYGPETRAPGGLPLGSSGRGLLLLSGGIDSPVAGYLMGKRGLKLEAVYFHTPPFTSEKAQEKVERLAAILSRYFSHMRLFVVQFTAVQMRIAERARPEETTLLMRACMVRIADLLSRKHKSLCLVTGESLGQVASQTPESMRFTASQTDFPVFRPLIGLDKEEIIRLARRIETFDTSTLPYEDCCTLFSPAHPLTRPNLARMLNAYARLEIDDLLEEAVREVQCKRFQDDLQGKAERP